MKGVTSWVQEFFGLFKRGHRHGTTLEVTETRLKIVCIYSGCDSYSFASALRCKYTTNDR